MNNVYICDKDNDKNDDDGDDDDGWAFCPMLTCVNGHLALVGVLPQMWGKAPSMV